MIIEYFLTISSLERIFSIEVDDNVEQKNIITRFVGECSQYRQMQG